jgi:2,5-diamino-6-(ribosylamino)-4(3H)-pyrimidinone 5'-phosphate reductase
MLSAPPAFLSQYLEGIHSNGTARPHITVTWAQSLDAKIAGPGGARVLLSGPESMEMTHWSVRVGRTFHAAESEV